MLADFMSAWARLRRTPGFTTAAVATLALGIGGTTAMFSLVNAILLKPMGYHEPGQLYTILLHVPKFAQRYPSIPVNAWHLEQWRKGAKTLDQVAAIGGTGGTLTGVGDALRVEGVRMSANTFRLLGVGPRLGRDFREDEDIVGKDRVIILSDALWRTNFGADPGVLGRKVLIDDTPFEVIGVMGPEFRFLPSTSAGAFPLFPKRTQYWKPMGFSESELRPYMGEMSFTTVARAKPATSQARILSELTTLEKNLEKSVPDPFDLRPIVEPLRDMTVRDVRRGLLLLLGAVGLVLLVGCLNLANLMLVRANGRRRELAIRRALGAAKGRLIRETLAESVLLSVAGCAVGLLLAQWLIDAAILAAPIELPRLDEVRLDGGVLVFALSISLLSITIFGFLPAWRSAAADPQEALQSASRSATAGTGEGRLRSFLVAAEVALSLFLLLGAGLLLRSFVEVLRVDPGFREENLIAADVSLPSARYRQPQQRVAFYRRMTEAVQSIPGHVASAWVSTLPVTRENNVNPVYAGDRPRPPRAEWPVMNYRSVSPEYFKVLGIPLRRGRVFAEADGDTRFVILSAAAAERLWPGEDPIGRELMDMGKPPYPRVAGVVGDVHVASLTQHPGMVVYTPLWQNPRPSMSLVVRAASNPTSSATEIRRAITEIDPQLAIPEMRTMDRVISESIAPRRFQMALLLAFAAMALLLASLGIYGVVSYAVSLRTNEIGIRMALGARSEQVRGMVLRQAMVPVVTGLALGLAGSFASAGLIRSFLYGINAIDPLTYVGVPSILLCVALAASALPARRATQIDPIQALRCE
jgi:putative ABC transport system permease protein